MKVLKFGGSSVGAPATIKKVIEIVENSGKDTLVVVSAFKGITDQIIKISEAASRGENIYEDEIREIRKRHLDAIIDLIPQEKKAAVTQYVNHLIDEMHDLLYGVYLVGDLAAKTRDHLLSFGERLSSYIISNAFTNARCTDMRHFIRTDSAHGNANVNFEKTNQFISEELSGFKGIAVCPGFIATNEHGQITTLGRGGSDYTAAILAAAVDAEILEIWTDVDGFMTADPRKVSKAYVIDTLSYSEALELSHFGAKVLYTPTLYPAYKKDIPIMIRNTFNLEAKGTLISREGGNGTESPIKGISSIDSIDLITLQGSGLPGVTGTSMRLFSALARERINIVLITQASSEYSISFAVSPTDSQRAVTSIKDEFQYEMGVKNIIDIDVEKDLSIIAIVGEKMRNTPGISAILFNSLGRSGISVIATAQGSSERNISVVIKKEQLRKALNVIHEGFFLSHIKDLHVYIAGTGNVGKDLINQIKQQREVLLDDHSLNIKVVGMINSRKMLVDAEGLDLDNYDNLMVSGEKSDLEKFRNWIGDLNLRNPVFVDCTANEKVSGLYSSLFDKYVSVVTANKIAASSEYENYLKLKKKAKEKGVRYIFETNVGAGLPIINTINDLIRSGDRILRLEAVLSGALNFIFNTLSEEVPLSKAIQLAKEMGFSEPDPRIDLSGKDVMRKLLILSRESGYKLEEKDIEVKTFLPDSLFKGSIDEFWESVKSLDEEFENKRKELDREGKRWRFVAIFDNGKGRVELLEVERDHPAYELAASNNIILITTERYKKDPMVIRGYGAGAAVTAAGVFADIIRIANV
jgi:aspartokinase/homoserine dehydrogenase 1